MGVGAHHVLDLAGDVPQLVGVGAHDTEVDGEGRIRAEDELGDSHARLGRQPFGDLLAQPQLEAIARFGIGVRTTIFAKEGSGSSGL